MPKKKRQEKDESQLPLPVDMLGLMEDFNQLVQNTDFSTIEQSGLTEEAIDKLEKQVEELRKKVEMFNSFADDLYKAVGLNRDEKEEILKDPSRNTAELRELRERIEHIDKQSASINKRAKEQAAAGGVKEEQVESNNNQVVDAREAAKKRKNLRGKKNWMPL
jgi:chromosome segregation ATPase